MGVKKSPDVRKTRSGGRPNKARQRDIDPKMKTTSSNPNFVVIFGGVSCGKTRFRREKFSSEYVNIDAGEIFIQLCRGLGLGDSHEFPSDLEESMEEVGQELARQAIAGRRNIVTEIIGDSSEDMNALVDAMRAAGYSADGIALTCSLDLAAKRNKERSPDDVSAYYTQKYHQKWLRSAANDFVRDNDRRKEGRADDTPG